MELGRRPRRWLVISSAAACTLVIASVLGLFVLYPYLGEQAIRSKLVGKLGKRVGHPVSVGDIDVSLGRAVLRDLTITAGDQTILAVDEIVVHFGVMASLAGQVQLESADISGVKVSVDVAADGTSPWDQALEQLRAPSGQAKRGRSTMPRQVRIRGGSIELRDLRRGITASAGGLGGDYTRGEAMSLTAADVSLETVLGPRAEIGGITVSGKPRLLASTAEVSIDDGQLTLWEGMSLTGVAGTISPGSEAGQLFVDLGGSWGGSSARLWTAKGNIAPIAGTGRLEVTAERFSLDKLADVLARSPLRDVDKTSLGVNLVIESDGQAISAAGSIDVAGLSVFHPKLAEETVAGVDFDGKVSATYDRESRTARLEEAVLRSAGVEYQLSGEVTLGTQRPLERVNGRLVIPPVDCQKMLEAIPENLVPKLQGFELTGTFRTDVNVAVDWNDLDATVLDGSVGIRKCRVRKPAKEMSAKKILGEFKHRVLVGRENGEDIYDTITIGPSSPDFVPLQDVSPYVVKSFMTTEDSSFYRHRGFIVKEFRTALIKNLKAGRFRYGASSISMQLIKNVYLDRKKTLSRKLQELFMTWYIETQVEKDRMMEVYVNAIEYGPALYGIGPAARRYFGKHPRDINPREAAFFSSILPAPRRRFRQYCKDKVSSWTDRKIDKILAKMYERGRLDEMELTAARMIPLVFNQEKKGCRRRRFR